MPLLSGGDESAGSTEIVFLSGGSAGKRCHEVLVLEVVGSACTRARLIRLLF